MVCVLALLSLSGRRIILPLLPKGEKGGLPRLKEEVALG